MTITSRPPTYTLAPSVKSPAQPIETVFCSPGVALYDTADLTGVPRLSRLPDGTLMIELARYQEMTPAEQESTPPQRVHEVARLCHRGLVIIAAELDVFVMHEKEYIQQLSALPSVLLTNLAISFEHVISDDTCDPERYGKVIGGSYFCGEGDAKAEVFVDYDNGTAWLWAFHKDSIALDLVERTLPNVITLLNDPQVQAACTENEIAASPTARPSLDERIKAIVDEAMDQHNAAPARVRDESYEVQVGAIAGCPVTATYWTSSGFVCVAMGWAGKRIMTDGDGLLNLGAPDVSYSSGDMGYTDWGRIKELAQTDVVEQLIALARKLDAESKRKLAA